MMLWGLKEIVPWMLSSSAARQLISPQELVKIAWSFGGWGLSTTCLPLPPGSGGSFYTEGLHGAIFCETHTPAVFLLKPKKIWNFCSKNGVKPLWFQRSQRNHIYEPPLQGATNFHKITTQDSAGICGPFAIKNESLGLPLCLSLRNSGEFVIFFPIWSIWHFFKVNILPPFRSFLGNFTFNH